MIQRCETCMGKKTIIGLGCLIKDCPSCKGVGHIKVVLDHDEVHIDNPKRGRPKKVSDER